MRSYVVLLLATVLAGASAAQALEVAKGEGSKLEVGGRLQLLASGQYLEDPHRDDLRPYLFLRQARFHLDGRNDDWRYRLSFALGGEVQVKAPTPGIALSLLDMYVDVPLRIVDDTWVRVGQFKVPYSRERLTESGALLYADRSINALGFNVGRDVGAALFTKKGVFSGGAGVFTGGGTSIPVRDLPLELGTPMLAARLGIDTGVDDDIFGQQEPMRARADEVQFAFFVNGLYSKDSLVGHSTVHNTKASDRPLYMNANWNPWLGRRPLAVGSMWQAGADAVVRAPVGNGTLTAEVEGNYGSYENEYGSVSLAGARGEVAYQLRPFEIGLRYAVLLPDEKFVNADGHAVTGKDPIHQVTPAISWTMEKTGLRLIADVPVQLGAPVATEKDLGNYVLTRMVDQTGYISGDSPVKRQNVFGARLLVQASF